MFSPALSHDSCMMFYLAGLLLLIPRWSCVGIIMFYQARPFLFALPGHFTRSFSLHTFQMILRHYLFFDKKIQEDWEIKFSKNNMYTYICQECLAPFSSYSCWGTLKRSAPKTEMHSDWKHEVLLSREVHKLKIKILWDGCNRRGKFPWGGIFQRGENFFSSLRGKFSEVGDGIGVFPYPL